MGVEELETIDSGDLWNGPLLLEKAESSSLYTSDGLSSGLRAPEATRFDPVATKSTLSYMNALKSEPYLESLSSLAVVEPL